MERRKIIDEETTLPLLIYYYSLWRVLNLRLVTIENECFFISFTKVVEVAIKIEEKAFLLNRAEGLLNWV